ncbi:MAG: biopolymer transporter ExbD, partial [Hyphomicrobiaceae bacterium]|nr:biopolymer transporter ExbD [Hyphomicrobiaceae bacterium]
MGMAMGGTGGGGRRGRGRRRVQPVSEINVTPFVDVMLVLLIVFMVSAPLLTVGVPVDLPETQARQIEAQTEPITISVTKDGQIFLMETEIDVEDVVTRLEAIAA